MTSEDLDFVVVDDETTSAFASQRETMEQLHVLIDLFEKSNEALSQSNILLKDKLRMALSVILQRIRPDYDTNTLELVKRMETSIDTCPEEVRRDYLRRLCSRLVAVNEENQMILSANSKLINMHGQPKHDGEATCNEDELKRAVYLLCEIEDIITSIEHLPVTLSTDSATLNAQADSVESPSIKNILHSLERVRDRLSLLYNDMRETKIPVNALSNGPLEATAIASTSGTSNEGLHTLESESLPLASMATAPIVSANNKSEETVGSTDLKTEDIGSSPSNIQISETGATCLNETVALAIQQALARLVQLETAKIREMGRFPSSALPDESQAAVTLTTASIKGDISNSHKSSQNISGRMLNAAEPNAEFKVPASELCGDSSTSQASCQLAKREQNSMEPVVTSDSSKANCQTPSKNTVTCEALDVIPDIVLLTTTNPSTESETATCASDEEKQAVHDTAQSKLSPPDQLLRTNDDTSIVAIPTSTVGGVEVCVRQTFSGDDIAPPTYEQHMQTQKFLLPTNGCSVTRNPLLPLLSRVGGHVLRDVNRVLKMVAQHSAVMPQQAIDSAEAPLEQPNPASQEDHLNSTVQECNIVSPNSVNTSTNPPAPSYSFLEEEPWCPNCQNMFGSRPELEEHFESCLS